MRRIRTQRQSPLLPPPGATTQGTQRGWWLAWGHMAKMAKLRLEPFCVVLLHQVLIFWVWCGLAWTLTTHVPLFLKENLPQIPTSALWRIFVRQALHGLRTACLGRQTHDQRTETHDLLALTHVTEPPLSSANSEAVVTSPQAKKTANLDEWHAFPIVSETGYHFSLLFSPLVLSLEEFINKAIITLY
jgi:hypothetical protein